MNDEELRQKKALARYQVISAYLALDPPRGQRQPLREQLAQKVWVDENGQPFQVRAETIRTWVRRYRKKGLRGLEDSPRPQRGVSVLTAEQVELCCALKREVPERSLDRILTITREMGLIPQDVLTRSTLHRVLKRADISRRPPPLQSDVDLDRFQADFPNELWQSDMLAGPWLPDPDRPGKMRRAYLYAFLDDYSRLLLFGRFSFKGDLPALELVLRRCFQRFGLCHRLYYDNGATYRADHMKQIVGELGIHPIIYTTAYRPMGHGKIEALNRFIRSAFIAELRASSITTLDALNEAFLAWADVHYNRRLHDETSQRPLERFRAASKELRYADEEKLRRAFLWREQRTTDKAGCFTLFGTRYQVGPELSKKRIDIRYDPEALHEIEVSYRGRFVERIRPFEVNRHRRPKPAPLAESNHPTAPPAGPPKADWLGHLVNARRKAEFIEPSSEQLEAEARQRREAQDQAIIDLFLDRLDPAVVNIAAVRAFLTQYGPLDLDHAQAVLDRLLAQHPRDQHVHFYLNAMNNPPYPKETR